MKLGGRPGQTAAIGLGIGLVGYGLSQLVSRGNTPVNRVTPHAAGAVQALIGIAGGVVIDAKWDMPRLAVAFAAANVAAGVMRAHPGNYRLGPATAPAGDASYDLVGGSPQLIARQTEPTPVPRITRWVRSR